MTEDTGLPWRNSAPPLLVADWWRKERRARERLSIRLSARSRRPVGVSGRRVRARSPASEDRKGGGAAAARAPRNARSAGGADR